MCVSALSSAPDNEDLNCVCFVINYAGEPQEDDGGRAQTGNDNEKRHDRRVKFVTELVFSRQSFFSPK